MGKVIPMFRIDEITGLQVPNAPYKPDYMIVDEYGRGYEIFQDYNKALACLMTKPDDYGIVKM